MAENRIIRAEICQIVRVDESAGLGVVVAGFQIVKAGFYATVDARRAKMDSIWRQSL